VPTLLAAFLVRPGEHRLSTRLLVGVRILILGSGLCSFAAAGALAGGWEGSHRLHIWRGCFVASIVFAMLLALAWALTSWRRYRNS
jgi:hypothetical protein